MATLVVCTDYKTQRKIVVNLDTVWQIKSLESGGAMLLFTHKEHIMAKEDADYFLNAAGR